MRPPTCNRTLSNVRSSACPGRNARAAGGDGPAALARLDVRTDRRLVEVQRSACATRLSVCSLQSHGGRCSRKPDFPRRLSCPARSTATSALFPAGDLDQSGVECCRAARVADDRSIFPTRNGAATERTNGLGRSELSSSPSESWLILADGRGTGERMAAAIEAAGGRCVLAEPGTRFDVLSDCRYRIRPAKPADYRATCERGVRSAIRHACHAVVHLLSCDISEPKSAAEWESAQVLSCGSALLPDAGPGSSRGPAEQGVVAGHAGAQSVAEDLASPAIAQAPLWGFGRALALEHPELWGGMIDLGPDRTRSRRCPASHGNRSSRR